MDRHTLAAISIAGSSLDCLGGVYLAYDLLGGKHGPLRTLTRAVTYGLIFGVGYGLPFGFVFGLASGITHGITLSLEYARVARQQTDYPFWAQAGFGAFRSLGFGIGAGWLYGWRFGLTFGLLSTLGQAAAYRFGIRPTMDYQPQTRPRMTRKQLLSTVNRTVGYALTGYVSGLVGGQEHSLRSGLFAGIAVGIVTAITIGASPWIEWTAENLPERRLGALGIGLILIGFVLQSVQYWVVVLDVSVS